MPNKKIGLRQRQAQMTQILIVDAAKKLFLEKGYAHTTIETIAEAAGVAGSTVYAVFRSKRGVLRAIRQSWHTDSRVREFMSADHGGATAEALLAGLAQVTCLQWETGLEVIAIYRSAAGADQEAAAELAEALAGRKQALDGFTARLVAHLRPELDLPTAAAVVRALCQAELYEELVQRSGWSALQYQDWLTDALKHQLLSERA